MRRILALLAALPMLAAPLGPVTAARADQTAPGGPGTTSHFDLARKDCLGTAYGGSKVWYTVAGGVLSDVYEPTIDNTNVESMRFEVTDGSTFTELQGRDTTYTVATDPSGMACTITTTSKAGRYKLVATYLTDPARDSVVVATHLSGAKNLKLYVRLDASINGNGGGGTTNGGADTGVVTAGSPVVSDENTTTNATNRDYAVPTQLALTADHRPDQASVGYVGTASDGATMLDQSHSLTTYTSAPNGNVVATEHLPLDHGRTTLALGFGRTQAQALQTANRSAARPFTSILNDYENGWRRYDRTLRTPPAGDAKEYYLSADVIRASEDKTFPGAVVASLASPWGQAVSAADLPGGKPVYFGSYREVFARDLYEAFTGFLTDGDLGTARAATRFLLERQQLPNGQLPRNSLVNGKTAPDTGGDQLDETAYPILMAYQSGLDGDATLWPHIRSAADFLVSHGPSFGVERWEEQSGYSPSTIAAEIAGLVAAGAAAKKHNAPDRARLYQATADDFARSVKSWDVTTTGPDAPRYFIRLSKTGDPNAAISYSLGNGGPTKDQRTVLDAGFLELTRLGILPAGDPDIRASLKVVDSVIKRSPGWYRYGADAQGTDDGYGDCYQPDPTDCSPSGKPWPTGNAGSGHPWPVLSGERAEQDLQAGDTTDATTLLTKLGSTGLVPEQVWEDPSLPASPYGSDPTTASIGYTPGRPAGSADPLTWAQAQYVRLALGLKANRPLEQPAAVRARYVDHGMPGALPLTVTVPGDVTTATVKVTGTTTAGAEVDIASTGTDVGGPTTVAETKAAPDGTYSATVPVSFGADVITATATDRGRTGYTQTTTVGEVTGGTTALDVTDPDGDDNGPGSYVYPTAADFHPGAFDIERFQVISDSTNVYLRTQLRDLTPTFGNAMGAQLLDVYVQQPGVTTTSTQAAFATRNYTLADPWTQRVEVQGFASPVWVDAAGAARQGAAVRASQTTRTITIALPKATFGTPGTGWKFAVVIAGQDGFSPDQARGFTTTAQPYTFGVCPSGDSAPICALAPASVPKAIDVVTPPGISQATELDPTKGAVSIHSVTVP